MVNEFKVGDKVAHEKHGNCTIYCVYDDGSADIVFSDRIGRFHVSLSDLRPRNFLSKIEEEQRVLYGRKPRNFLSKIAEEQEAR